MATGAASLALLKGGNKKAPPAPAPEPVAEEVEITVDPEKMNNKELDAFAVAQALETPAEWDDWGAVEKRAWLTSQFENVEATEEAPFEVTPVAAEPAPKPAKAKKASKAEQAEESLTAAVPAVTGKPKKGKKVLDGVIDENDVISVIVSEVETLSKKDALVMASTLDEATLFGMFKLGGVFSKIKDKGWFDPYPTFKDWILGEHGVDARTAAYWLKTYKSMSSNGVPWSKVEHLGWTKLKEIADIIHPGNVDEWVKVASDKKVNTLTLHDMVKEYKKGGNKLIPSISPEDGAVKITTIMTFKVHDDQKQAIRDALEKAKEASGTAVDTVALEYICLDFTSGKHLPFDLTGHLKGLGVEKALEALQSAFPQANIAVELPDEESAAA